VLAKFAKSQRQLAGWKTAPYSRRDADVVPKPMKPVVIITSTSAPLQEAGSLDFVNPNGIVEGNLSRATTVAIKSPFCAVAHTQCKRTLAFHTGRLQDFELPPFLGVVPSHRGLLGQSLIGRSIPLSRHYLVT